MTKKNLASKLIGPVVIGVASLFSGCNFNESPNPIRLSSCGSQIVYNSKTGENAGLVKRLQGIREEQEPQTTTAVYDLKNDKVRFYENNNDYPGFYSVSGDTVAYSVFQFEGLTPEVSYVCVNTPNDGLEIQNAFFPVLSPDQEKLAYMSLNTSLENNMGLFESLENKEAMESLFERSSLKTRNLKNQESQVIESYFSIPLDFSPDSARLLYFSVDPSSDTEQREISLNYYDFQNNQKNNLGFNPEIFVAPNSEPDLEPLILNPGFINNEQIIFSAYMDQTQDHPQIIISDLEGKLEQVTDNNLFKRNYAADSSGRVFYTASEDSIPPYELFVAERAADGTWTSTNTQNQMLYMTVAGDNLVFMNEQFNPERQKPLPLFRRLLRSQQEIIPASGGEVFMTSLENAVNEMNPEEITNISQRIAQKLKNKR